MILFIIGCILPYSTQKCKFRKIDMDFGFVASTLKSKFLCQDADVMPLADKCMSWAERIGDLWLFQHYGSK